MATDEGDDSTVYDNTGLKQIISTAATIVFGFWVSTLFVLSLWRRLKSGATRKARTQRVLKKKIDELVLTTLYPSITEQIDEVVDFATFSEDELVTNNKLISQFQDAQSSSTPSISEEYRSFSGGDSNLDMEESTKLFDGFPMSQFSLWLGFWSSKDEKLFRIESYSPMNRDYKIKKEVSDCCVVIMLSRSHSSRVPPGLFGPTITTNSETLQPVSLNEKDYLSVSEEHKRFNERPPGKSVEMDNIRNWSYIMNSGNIGPNQVGGGPKHSPVVKKDGVNRAITQQLSSDHEESSNHRLPTSEAVRYRTEDPKVDTKWHRNPNKYLKKSLTLTASKSQ